MNTIDILSKLISFKTISELSNKKLAQYISNYLAKYNIIVKLCSPGFVNTKAVKVNVFKMPGLVEPNVAAKIILNNINSNKFEITFCGHFLSMNKMGVMTTGIEWEEDRSESLAASGSTEVMSTDKLPKDICDGLRRFVANIEKLPDDFKKQILEKVDTRIKIDWPE